MPKTNKTRSSASSRHAPLGQVMQEDTDRGKYAKMSKNRKKLNDDDEGNEETLDAKTSERILKLSHAQVLEEEQRAVQENAKYELDSDSDAGSEEGVDEEGEFDEDAGADEIVVHDSGYVSVDGPGLTSEEEAMVAAMCGKSGEERRTLADIILEKIKEGEEEQQQAQAGGEGEAEEFIDLPPKVVEVYTDIGMILRRYTAGKLPKAFKVIPCLSNWEEVLYLTRPDLWSPQAMFAATRIFASNLNPRMAQRFYNLVLLDSVRADIVENKKLNYHYYMALKKAIYKPAAWFKGILLPLCKENCTLREAAIIASILQKVSIPMHHSAVAIHKLAQMEYSGATSIFLKTLLNKKYSLPAPVIESLVKHFGNFIHERRELPVLWHQSLLVFVQRYKNFIQDERSREALKLVMKTHSHPKITPEIRRELFGNRAWKDGNKSSAGSVATGTQSMDM